MYYCFCVLLFSFFVFNMSNITAEELKAILDEKLASVSSKMSEIRHSMDLIKKSNSPSMKYQIVCLLAHLSILAFLIACPN